MKLPEHEADGLERFGNNSADGEGKALLIRACLLAPSDADEPLAVRVLGVRPEGGVYGLLKSRGLGEFEVVGGSELGALGLKWAMYK